MRIIFIINDIKTEKDNYTTIRLARRALKDRHRVALISLVDLTYQTSGEITGAASIPLGNDYKDDAELLEELQDPRQKKVHISLTKVDVILLRADPAEELAMRPWAPSSSLLFAQLAVKAGVIVLNDPYHLTDASNKTYYQQYPAFIRPRTCISRDPNEIKRFIEQENGKAVIKPLQGSGGHGVFLINETSGNNINQIIEATIRYGYAIVQEYIPQAAEGDLRLITLNGKPLKVNGVYACFKRFNETEDMRSNITAGGSIELSEPTQDALEIARIIGPQLKHDGMYLSGLDIVGDKMIEVNVDTPGGINMAEDLTGEDFSGAIINDLQRKVDLRNHYRGYLRNREIAIM